MPGGIAGTGPAAAATPRSWRRRLGRWGLTLALLSAAAFILAAVLAIAAGDPAETATPATVVLQSGVRRLPWFAYPLIGVAAAVIGQTLFATAWARLAATALGTVFVLYSLMVPELWTMAGDVDAMCRQRTQSAPSADCGDLGTGLYWMATLALLLWGVNIVLPVTVAATVLHGVLLLSGVVLRGTLARLRGQAAS